MDEERIRKLVRELIAEIGEDPTREGLTKTPVRVADAYKEIFAGYDSNSELSVQFSEDSEVVVVRDIQFYSMCEHHILPFFGKIFRKFFKNSIFFISGIESRFDCSLDSIIIFLTLSVLIFLTTDLSHNKGINF